MAADFFDALFDPARANGAVDLALNRARRLLYDRRTPLWAPPVLFCRLQAGLLYTPPAMDSATSAPPAPTPTSIPSPRTNLLVGRDEDLQGLRTRLIPGAVSALVGVQGLGGIGKTELAIAAALHIMAVLDALPLCSVADWQRAAFWQPEAVQAADWLATRARRPRRLT